MGKERRHGVSNLLILRGSGAEKAVIVGECLDSGGLPDRQAAALRRVGVYVVVAVLRNVRRDRRRGTVRQLDPKAIREHIPLHASADVLMFGEKRFGELAQNGGAIVNP